MIILKNVSKTYITKYGDIDALKDINIEVNKNDYISIMGASGCGKSTLLRIIGCIDSFDRGTYLWDGMDVHKFKSRKLAKLRNEKIGFVFQSFNLVPYLTVYENIEVPMGYAGKSVSARKQRINELLNDMGLTEKAKCYPNQLSGGQQQRVAIARSLVNSPEIILADEPTGNLDADNALNIMKIFDSLHDEGKTIILVTHDKDIAFHAKRNILLDKGSTFLDAKEHANIRI